VPGEDTWQNTAITDVENNRNQLAYTTLKTEEEYNKDTGLIQQYGSYLKYKADIEKQIDTLNTAVFVAQSSLDKDMPDMKYAQDGARNWSVQFLDYSVLVAIFGVLVGGWIIASEFQQGTIRLLMIRPRGRIKILMSKFLSALLVCLGIYVVGTLINIVLNGIVFGFNDFSFPNYTISGEVGFFAYFLPKFLMCISTVLLGFTSAFMLSVLTKNTAVSIIVPVICYIGCYMAMGFIAFREAIMQIVAYTPIPYVQLSSFFNTYQFFTNNQNPVQQAIQNGITFSIPLGIGMLLFLSVAFTAVSILVFKKRDITN
jgi:ABC-2 type transport system permease protein